MCLICKVRMHFVTLLRDKNVPNMHDRGPVSYTIADLRGVCKQNETSCCMARPGTVAASIHANLKNPSAGFHLQLTPRRIYEA
ncbi:MAG: hypothetical protein ACD_23C00847G0002 [uncultured bacterium]|nr:MAG: hypothetical protein ACD_23C00847G0002 [uncultured bacterium]